MKLELTRQEFLKAWQITEKTAMAKTPIDIVNSIRINANDFSNVTLEATDLKTSVKCRAEGVTIIEPGTAILPAALLGGMLRKLKCKTLTIEIKNTHGMLFAEGSKTRFTVVPVEEFPNIPESAGAETKCEIPAATLAKVIMEGSIASSQPQDFPKYLGSCLLKINDGKIKAVSTDGKRLAVSEAFCSVYGQEDIMTPSQALKDIAKQFAGYGDDNARILSDGSTVWFSLEDVEFSLRRIEANFPDYERILNTKIQTELHMSCDDLISVVERVDLVARTTTSHIMVIDMNPNGRLRVYARAPEGIAGEFLEADITGEEMKVGFNSSYFIDGLRALGSSDIAIEFSGTEEQTRMKRQDDSSFLYMLMPSRLSPMDIVDDDLNTSEPDPQPESQDETQSEAQESESESDNDMNYDMNE